MEHRASLQDSTHRAQWLRLFAMLAVLVAAILIPFAIWGDMLDKSAPTWLGSADNRFWLAMLGIGLLVADILLPIPSSVVGMGLCWSLGPLWGGVSFAAGMTLSFGLGYALGRLVPHSRLRAWIGSALWDAVHRRVHGRALWWIVIARPLPLLAEMSAMLAGVLRIPAGAALGTAAVSSCGVATLYALCAYLGQREPGMGWTLLATIALPSILWGIHRVIVQRMREPVHRSLGIGLVAVLVAFSAGMFGPSANAQSPEPAADKAASARHTYYTGGVHNNKGCEPPQSCVYKRAPTEPSDPKFPKWWTSDWTMYRVFKNFDVFPPPYDSPPQGLTPSDYEISYGTSYYDSTYIPKDKDGRGAMMEFYDKRCLPIFPMDNKFNCAFVSLGNKAYFLRYEDRPEGTPSCCQFSLFNHPPRRDFIKHLPYNAQQSTHVGGSIQAYSRLVGPQKILFGYAFNRQPTSDDPQNPAAPKYRHPQSFFFSGYPLDPPNAPIVSQNYTNFRALKPDPLKTWDQVAQMCTPNPGWCCLFKTDCPGNSTSDSASKLLVPSPAASTAASWADLRSGQK